MADLVPLSDDRPMPVSRRVIALTFGAIFVSLVAGYWFFLTGSYAPAFTGLRPAEASAVVGQLAAKTIPYRLQDGGTTIMVPADQVDATRVAIAGSNVPMKGGVGFELFNKSDMGLTDFAQRINYQRALQGELERSIMMLDDVETARVHLAMPERTLFRTDRNAAKAAVELVGKDHRWFDAARVAGIQRLVAAAVPDLMPADVVVLDADGKLLSSSAGAPDDALTPEAEERRAVSSYYRARIRSAIAQVLPGIDVDAKVLVDSDAASPSPVQETPAATTPDAGAARTFGLRMTIETPAPLNMEDRGRALSALKAAVGFDERLGDMVSFDIGIANAPALSPQNATASSRQRATPASVVAAAPAGLPFWLGGPILIVALVVVVVLLMRRRSTASLLSDVERSAMVARLQASLRDGDASHV